MHVQLPCSYRGPIRPYGGHPGGQLPPPDPPGSFPGGLPPPRTPRVFPGGSPAPPIPGVFPGGLLPPRNIQDPGIVCENAAC